MGTPDARRHRTAERPTAPAPRGAYAPASGRDGRVAGQVDPAPLPPPLHHRYVGLRDPGRPDRPWRGCRHRSCPRGAGGNGLASRPAPGLVHLPTHQRTLRPALPPLPRQRRHPRGPALGPGRVHPARMGQSRAGTRAGPGRPDRGRPVADGPALQPLVRGCARSRARSVPSRRLGAPGWPWWSGPDEGDKPTAAAGGAVGRHGKAAWRPSGPGERLPHRFDHRVRGNRAPRAARAEA